LVVHLHLLIGAGPGAATAFAAGGLTTTVLRSTVVVVVVVVVVTDNAFMASVNSSIPYVCELNFLTLINQNLIF
jgi:hypothetical protein